MAAEYYPFNDAFPDRVSNRIISECRRGYSSGSETLSPGPPPRWECVLPWAAFFRVTPFRRIMRRRELARVISRLLANIIEFVFLTEGHLNPFHFEQATTGELGVVRIEQGNVKTFVAKVALVHDAVCA